MLQQMETDIYFLGRHYLCGIASQILAYDHQHLIQGQILTGSFLLRKYRNSTTYPVSTLALFDELDGLCVTRITESFYFYSKYPHFTIVVKGMNHMQTASGKPPSHIEKNDLVTEISDTDAHEQLASIINALHVVYEIPDQFPHLFNNCSSYSCILQLETVTQNIYDSTDTFDTGFSYISADEMRIKMMSRQSILEASQMKTYNFNEIDGSSFRYQSKGRQLVIDEDDIVTTRPSWILGSLKYVPGVDSQGKPILTIKSSTLKLPSDYPIKSLAGIHYCKVLSSARVIE
ncbi:unnamed protein product [Didymodactylos carnosus]|uniref:Uncharacterized protein n=1 Tax=Didymodactylos carnosus TaxID=1234261 RepID=A0A814FKR1_9BILA|nr:unnamed protein product [Didymodactylos carnosus]CAF3756468.1 unnamed protein product [Didymodactylos carnosus]